VKNEKNALAGLSPQASMKKQALMPENVSYAIGFVCFYILGCSLYYLKPKKK